jgi:hypothetical protein
MPFALINRRSWARRSIRNTSLDHTVHDVTSRGDHPWQRFSPLFPHGGIPVPFSPGVESESVEGIWQGLKVFETQDVDASKFRIRSMKDLKRTTRRFGRVLGHRKGVHGDELLSYVEARHAIYLPSYRWVLENHLQALLRALEVESESRLVILLDYSTNDDPEDTARPLSHAGLIVRYLENRWPAGAVQ